MGEFKNRKTMRFMIVFKKDLEVSNESARKIVEDMVLKVFPSMESYFSSDDYRRSMRFFGPYDSRGGKRFYVSGISYESVYLYLEALNNLHDEWEKRGIIFVGEREKFPPQMKDGVYLVRGYVKNAKGAVDIVSELDEAAYIIRKVFGFDPGNIDHKKITISKLRKVDDVLKIGIEAACGYPECSILHFLRFKGVGEMSFYGYGDFVIRSLEEVH